MRPVGKRAAEAGRDTVRRPPPETERLSSLEHRAMDFDAARLKMVDNQIRTTDVTEHGVLRAFLSVPRERFVPEDWRPLAYIDEDLPLGGGRFVMEPSPFARLLQLAAVRTGDVVLDVGCGTGYSAAILSHLATSIVALESDPALAAEASGLLAELDILSAAVVEGPLEAGWPGEGPYDVILLEGAVEAVSPALFEQLREGGRLVAVEGVGNAALAKLYLREPNGTVSERVAFNCAVKPLPGFRRPRAFAF